MPVQRLLFLCFLLLMFAVGPVQAEPNRVDALRFLDRFQNVKVLNGTQNVGAIDLETATNDRLKLSSLRGKWIIMNIWATWCAPCIEEMPTLDRLKMMRASPDFDVLAVSVDLNKSGPRISYFLKRWNIKYIKALYDDTRVANKTLETGVLPVTYVINPQGRAVAVLSGPAHWASEEALAFVDTLQSDPNLFRYYSKQNASRKKP